MEFITYEQEGFVGVLTINRPKALNALNKMCIRDRCNLFLADEINRTSPKTQAALLEVMEEKQIKEMCIRDRKYIMKK